MDFSVRCLLSGVRDGTAEVGEVLVTVERITDGDPDSWLEEFCGLGRRLLAESDVASGQGRRRTGWGLALRAANYLFGGAWWAPVTHRSGEVLALWEQHRTAWDKAVALWPTPSAAVTIPTPAGGLPGYRFSLPAGQQPRGVVLMVQGLDTPLSDACMTGLSEGLRRGWEVVLVEGPGQGAALLRNGLSLADDWTGVVGAAAGWARDAAGGDATPLVAMGVNHGSWFVLDALADGSLDAGAVVLDPGVVELRTDSGVAVDDPIASAKLLMATGADDLQGALAVMDRYRMGPEALGSVATPAFVAEAQSAQSFVGQGDVVAAGLAGTVHVESFIDAAGAGLDCEIGAPQVRNAAVYDWLDSFGTKGSD